jgi:D-cysteine desulfhydrase
MTLEPPPRVPLARLPTPLEPAARLSARLGVPLWWKRDDLTGAELSGNKVRKLELLFADAEARGADMVVTCGGVQSNHCRATALAAARRGLDCLLLLRVPDPARPPAPAANSLLDHLAGARIRYVTPEQYRQNDQLFAATERDLARDGRRPYLIPEGGSNALGAWGYVAAIAELRAQLAPLDDGAPGTAATTTIVYAAGSGGTGAGIELGLRLSGWTGARAVGVAVCDSRAFFQQKIAAIAAEASRRWDLGVSIAPGDVDIDDRFIGPGYAQSTPEMLAVIGDVARAEGVILDPVYTGKAFFALTRILAADRRALGDRVIFLHTGGIFGLFPFAGDLVASSPT